jgi:hypothetical protein
MYSKGLFDDIDKCRPITIIHDEIVGAVRRSCLEEMMPKLYDCVCRKYADMEIDISSTPEIGSHFGSLTKWESENE